MAEFHVFNAASDGHVTFEPVIVSESATRGRHESRQQAGQLFGSYGRLTAANSSTISRLVEILVLGCWSSSPPVWAR